MRTAVYNLATGHKNEKFFYLPSILYLLDRECIRIEAVARAVKNFRDADSK